MTGKLYIITTSGISTIAVTTILTEKWSKAVFKFWALSSQSCDSAQFIIYRSNWQQLYTKMLAKLCTFISYIVQALHVQKV